MQIEVGRGRGSKENKIAVSELDNEPRFVQTQFTALVLADAADAAEIFVVHLITVSFADDIDVEHKARERMRWAFWLPWKNVDEFFEYCKLLSMSFP